MDNYAFTYTRKNLIQDIHQGSQIIPYQLNNELNTEIILPKNSKFIIDIPEYFNNTSLSDDHINQLSESIIKDSVLIGDFIAVQCVEEDDDIYLIDGHHRKAALTKLTAPQLENVKIKLTLYHVDKIESDLTYKLFCNINNVKPHAVNKRYTHDAREIVDKLQKQHQGFYKGLVKSRSNNSKVNKPRININSFINNVENYLRKKKKYNIEDIIANLISYNDSIEKKKYHTIFMYDINKNISLSQKEKYVKLKTQMKDVYNGFYMSTPYGENWIYDKLFA